MAIIPAHPRDAFIKNIFATIAPEIDILSSLFCFGMDSIWRKKLVELAKIQRGEKILDVCAGTGKLAFLLAGKASEQQGSVIGADFCQEMLEVAKKKLGADASRYVSFVLSDAKDLIFDDNVFDVVTVGFGMRNILDTSMALHEVHRVLKPGGRFYCLELTCPQTRWLMPFYNYYCFNIMPAVAKMVLNTDIPYNYLPRSIQAFPLADEFRHIIERCGFNDVKVYRLSFGIATIFEARKQTPI
ncbi:MAG: bifunctional demethylmenaquinone methyltransferase/2-methoxy-6-polyprenyl-1,4-benzoquinol methylase UbiE [Nitrospirae bacterium]|nr:bifunctional demethylmenaquinone methyltransferase/2-methoxy-6-polyprenyl-1,4-benzoquinol methylase UbiE [Nitrospirota bacterium]